MIMAAKALLDREPRPDPRRGGRRDLRQHLPLHRLRADHQRGPAPRAADSAARNGLKETRDGTSPRTSSPTSARTTCKAVGTRPAALRRARPRHRPDPVLRGPAASPACCTSRWCAARTTTRASSTSTPSAAEKRAGRRARPHPQGRAAQLVHDPDPDRGRARTTSRCCAEDKVLFKGEPIVAVLAETERGRPRGARRRSRSTTRTCRRSSTSRRR